MWCLVVSIHDLCSLSYFFFLLQYCKVLLFLFKFLIIAFLDLHSFKSKFNFKHLKNGIHEVMLALVDKAIYTVATV